MEIEFFGANCFKIKTKKTSLIFDDNLDTVGGKNIAKDQDVLFYTNKNLESKKATDKARLVIDSAGEFEVGDISVKAIQTRSHMDKDDEMTATVYQCMFSGKTITIVGHIHPELADEVIELAGGTDVLIVPVGGNGYTLDGVGANSVIRKVEPDVVIPSQYESKSLRFEVPATPLDEFVKISGLSADEPSDVYKVDKPNAELATQTHLVILNTK